MMLATDSCAGMIDDVFFIMLENAPVFPMFSSGSGCRHCQWRVTTHAAHWRFVLKVFPIPYTGFHREALHRRDGLRLRGLECSAGYLIQRCSDASTDDVHEAPARMALLRVSCDCSRPGSFMKIPRESGGPLTRSRFGF